MDFYVVKEIVEANEQKLLELFVKTQNMMEDNGANERMMLSARKNAARSWRGIEDMLSRAKTVEDLIFVNTTICEIAAILMN